MTEDAAITQQRALYGASLAQLTGDVMASFGLSQAALARILGLSAPMLSQLISGHRVKIGNPAAVHRLQALVALAPRSAALSASELEARLDAIRGEQATITEPAVGRSAADELRRLAPPEELARLADLTTAPALAAYLRGVAQGQTGG